MNPLTQRPVRVRFAPSPTGYLHVGGARTALYNYLFAKKNNGKFILRVEDTDLARSTDQSLKMVIEDLKWLGLDWDEGPDSVTLNDQGDLGPYRQSQRLSIYKEHAFKLLKEDKAYYCFMTDQELEAQRENFLAAGRAPHVDSPYKTWTLEQAQAELLKGRKGALRFKTEGLKKNYIFNDLVRSRVDFPSDMVGDFVILRSDGMPVYNFCNVIDDYLMKISHVLRAEEHLPNTLRQLMLYEAFGWEAPEFGHLSLILDEDRKKLSKRKGATSCHEFKNEGYLPEALNNFVALLGWSDPSGEEILSLEKMISNFSLERLNSAGAVFDPVKLKWMNSQYLKTYSDDDLFKLLGPYFKSENINVILPADKQAQAIKALRTTFETLQEGALAFRVLDNQFFEIEFDSNEVMSWESSPPVVLTWAQELSHSDHEYLTEALFLEIQEKVKNQTGAKGKFLFMALRVAVLGKPHGLELKLIVPLISKQALILRAEKVLGKYVKS